MLFVPVVMPFPAPGQTATLRDPLVTALSALDPIPIFLDPDTAVLSPQRPSPTFSTPRKCMSEVVVAPVHISNLLSGVVVHTATFPALPVALNCPVYPVSM